MRKSQLEDKSVKSSGGSYQNLCRVENDLNKRDLEDLKGKTSDCVLYMQGLEERLVAVEGKIGLITKSVEDKFEAIHSALFVLDNSARTTKVSDKDTITNVKLDFNDLTCHRTSLRAWATN